MGYIYYLVLALGQFYESFIFGGVPGLFSYFAYPARLLRSLRCVTLIDSLY